MRLTRARLPLSAPDIPSSLGWPRQCGISPLGATSGQIYRPSGWFAQMPKPNALKLSARFAAVLYAATNGRSGQFRRIDDCAAHAGITRAADVKRAVATAEAAGLLVVHVSEPLVMLTTKGCEVAQPGRGE